MHLKDIWLFRLAAILLLFNAFLVSAELPNGLFTTKEIGLWLGAGIGCILMAIKLTDKAVAGFSVKLIDIAVLLFLILLPLKFIIDKGGMINTDAILNQMALGFAYLVFRILSFNIRPLIFINAVIEIFIITLLFQLIIAIAQYFNLLTSYYPEFGATGMFFNPGPFAIYTISLGVMAGILFLNSVTNKNYPYLIFYGLLFITSVFFAIHSFSRSAWIGGAAGLIMGSICLYLPGLRLKIPGKPLTKLSIAKGYHLILAGALLLVPFLWWMYRFKEASANGRLLTWKVTGLMLKAHWITGFGPGNFAANYVNYQADFFSQSQEHIDRFGNIAGDNRFAFNDLLEIFAEKGIAGLMLFILILLLCILQVLAFKQVPQKKQVRLMVSCALAGLTVIIVAGLTSYPLAMLPIALLFWFLVAVLATIAPGKFIPVLRFKYVLVLLFFAVGLSYLYFGVTRINAYRNLTMVTERETGPEKTEKLLLLYGQLKNRPEYLSELIDAYMENKKYTKAIPYLKRAIKFSPYKELYYKLGRCYEMTGDDAAAVLQYLKIHFAIPNLLKPRYLLAKAYYSKGDFEAFKKAAHEAVNFTPKVNSPEIMEMKRELYTLLQK